MVNTLNSAEAHSCILNAKAPAWQRLAWDTATEDKYYVLPWGKRKNKLFIQKQHHVKK